MILRAAYRLYARRLRAGLAAGTLPRHVAVIIDGNRRWARQQGYANVSVGHRHGAEHVEELLDWCAGLGITHVTVFLASIDNLSRRSPDEIDYLMHGLVEQIVPQRLLQPSKRWRIHVAGHLDVLPDSTRNTLKQAEATTSDRDHGLHLTLAVGYDGRQEVTDAVRDLLVGRAAAGSTVDDLARTLTPDDVGRYLYTAGRPDPDLVIRTSGEKRLSSFLLWQTVHSQLYFCDVYWPAFRYVDFIRALRAYAMRARSVAGGGRTGNR